MSWLTDAATDGSSDEQAGKVEVTQVERQNSLVSLSTSEGLAPAI